VKTLHGLESIAAPLERSVLTIGNFDGVHRAHQQLLTLARSLAEETQGSVVVLTFEPHPLTIVSPAKAPPRLMPLEEKLRWLEAAGADITVLARSEPALLDLEAEEFIREVVRKRFNPAHIVEGPSFGFGRGRKGTPELLQRVAGSFGCEVHIVGPVTIRVDTGEDLLVSSSLIRKLVVEGRVRRAAACLGRPYCLVGSVVEGDQRGRTIGFPTANVAVADQLIPADAVYAGRAETGGASYACAISIGNAPTFSGTQRRVEAHLLDFDGGELYGAPIRIEIERRIRGQRSFPSAEALAAQLSRDVESVRAGSNADDPKASESGIRIS